MNGSDSTRAKVLRLHVPFGILAVYLVGYVFLAIRGDLPPFELFNLILVGGAVATAFLVARGSGDALTGNGILILIAAHGLIGQKLAPDSLTSGAILMVGILILYVGIRIHDNLPRRFFVLFCLGYLSLFWIFVVRLDNAEALFLLALMGLAATSRDLRTFAGFWAIVAAFTVCQPYAWPSVLILLFLLKVLFSLKTPPDPVVIRVFLVCGLLLVSCVLLPILVLVLEEDHRSVLGALREPSVRDAILLTALTATISTGILAVLGIPFAWGLARCSFWGRSFLLSIIDLPIVIPQSAAGIALLGVFGGRQYIGEQFARYGIRFEATVAGIVIAQVFVAMPFLVKGALAAFESVPPSLEDNARTLGASSLSVFRRVSLPLAARGVFLGLVLSWARAAGEFGAVYFVAAHPETAPIAVFNRFESVGLAETAPLVVALILFSALLFLLLQWMTRLLPNLHERGALR